MEQHHTKKIFTTRVNSILALSLPIVGAMVSQNVLNLVDTAMVGRLGDSALAAVGLGGFAAFVAQSIILGISSGVQAIAARRKGENKMEETAVPLNGGLIITCCAGIPLSFLLFFLVKDLYPYLNADPDVIAMGIPYLQVRILATTFVGMNYAFRGYWNAVNLARLYMSTLVIMHSSNIFLNYVLIFGNFGAPELGVTGAGIATSISTVIGTLCYFILGFKYARENGFLKQLPKKETMKTLISLSLPNGIQQLFFAAGFTATYWIIGKVGTSELAAANVLINLTLVAILPGIAFGIAATTLVGQALGRKDTEDAEQWGWDVTKVAMCTLFLLGAPMWLLPRQVLSVFIINPATIEIARIPIILVGVMMAFEAIGLVLANALLGAGDSRNVMIVSVLTQWIIFLPAAYYIGPIWGFGLLGIWIWQGIYRSIQSSIYFFIWRNGKWKTIKV